MSTVMKGKGSYWPYPDLGGTLVVATSSILVVGRQVTRVVLFQSGTCTELAGIETLPLLEQVDLNDDPKQRWGRLQGRYRDVGDSEPLYTGSRNRGERRLGQAGVTKSGVPWMLFHTRSTGAGPRRHATDLYTWSSGAWQGPWTGAGRTGELEGSTAVSCLAQPDAIATIETMPDDSSSGRPSRAHVRSWHVDGSTSIRGARSGHHHVTQSVAYCESVESLTVAGVAAYYTDAANLIIRRFDVQRHLESSFEAAGAAIPMAAGVFHGDGRPDGTTWGVRFRSSVDLVLWREGLPRLGFRYSTASGSWTQALEAQATPEERWLARVRAVPNIKLESLHGVPREDSVWMVLRDDGGMASVLTDQPTADACAP